MRPFSVRSLSVRSALLVTCAIALAGFENAAAQTKTIVPEEYGKVYVQMNRALRERDFAKAGEFLDKMEALLPPNSRTLTARASIKLNERNFKEGRALLGKALQLDPRCYPARFDLAESFLMEGRYEEARGMFEKLLQANSRDELVQFRIFLTYLLEKNDPAARAELGKMKFPGDTAAFYYANAAWEFAHDNPVEGKAWIARGNWIFPNLDQIVNFSESLVELGWIERPKTEEQMAANKAEPEGLTAPKSTFGFKSGLDD